jgi:integrase
VRRLKDPKRASHKRKIQIDDALVRLLVSVREQHLRLVAGVPDGAQVDLFLVKLPEGALMFPSFHGGNIDLTKLRNAKRITVNFENHARNFFPGLRFHDLRGSHETALLDEGVPVHVVAERCGHDPATLLRSYAKRTKKADKSAADVIAACRGQSWATEKRLGPSWDQTAARSVSVRSACATKRLINRSSSKSAKQ